MSWHHGPNFLPFVFPDHINPVYIGCRITGCVVLLTLLTNFLCDPLNGFGLSSAFNIEFWQYLALICTELVQAKQ